MTEPIKMVLRFNPFSCGCEDTAAVFRDFIARRLYILWRRQHLVGEDFAAQSLKVADRIRETKPQSTAELRACFSVATTYRWRDPFTSGDADRFCEHYVNYFIGETLPDVRYEIKEDD